MIPSTTPPFILEEQILDFHPIACFKTRLAEFPLIMVLPVQGQGLNFSLKGFVKLRRSEFPATSL